MENIVFDQNYREDIDKKYKDALKKILKFKDIKMTHDSIVRSNNEEYAARMKLWLEKNKNKTIQDEFDFENYPPIANPWIDTEDSFEHAPIFYQFIGRYFENKKIQDLIQVIHKISKDREAEFDYYYEKLTKAISNQDFEAISNIQSHIGFLKTTLSCEIVEHTTELILISVEELRKNKKIFKKNINIFNMNSTITPEKKELQKAIDETMLKVTQTAGLSDFLYAIPVVTKHGHIDEYDTSKQVYINEDKDIEFTISIPEAFKKNPMLTENHVKLFLFSLHKHCTGDKRQTLIPYKEFFSFKGLEDNKDNRKKLKKEIEELESVEFDYKYKEKGSKEWTKVSKARAISYLDTRPGSGISVAFGTWAEYIPSTFIDINKAVFKYPVTRNSVGATTISFKLRELSSMNKKSVRVRILTDLLDISENVINKHGFSWVKDKLERELERIEEAEKLQWQYRNGIHDSRIDFENDYIEFKYPNS